MEKFVKALQKQQSKDKDKSGSKSDTSGKPEDKKEDKEDDMALDWTLISKYLKLIYKFDDFLLYFNFNTKFTINFEI